MAKCNTIAGQAVAESEIVCTCGAGYTPATPGDSESLNIKCAECGVGTAKNVSGTN